MYVYLLVCSDNSTYVGATVNLDRRLRQHNGEIKGGAVATTSKVKQGKHWTRVCYVSNFPDWSAALQFEWRWKHLSRKHDKNMFPLERRLCALSELLDLEKPTLGAIEYVKWNEKPCVNVEHNFDICAMYLNCESDTYNIN